jgi:anti-sigma B factor antagonist
VNLSINVRRDSPAIGIIDIKGDVSSTSEDALATAYEEAAAGSTKAVVLNFAALDYLNSGGIGLLVTLLVRANRQHQHLLACGLSDHYREIFELTRLDEAITLHATEASALAAAARL